MYRADTSEGAQKVYDRKIRELTDEERFLRGISLTHFGRQICFESIRQKNPLLTEGEIKARFFEQVYGHLFSPSEREEIGRHMKVHP